MIGAWGASRPSPAAGSRWAAPRDNRTSSRCIVCGLTPLTWPFIRSHGVSTPCFSWPRGAPRPASGTPRRSRTLSNQWSASAGMKRSGIACGALRKVIALAYRPRQSGNGAARCGREAQRYPWGNEIPAWIPAHGKGPRPAPWLVTLGEPNDFGLYGIAANIHEWCSDWHSKTYYADSPQRNPAGATAGVRRASRGGSWRHAVTISRNAARSKLDPAFRYTDYGFRLARSTS